MKLIFVLCASLLTSLAFGKVIVKEGRIKLVPKSSRMTAAFGSFVNDSKKTIELVKASSPISEFVEFHTHKKEKGVIKMRRIPVVKIGAGETFKMKPGADHLMFIKLKKAVWEQYSGSKKPVPVKLFDKSGKTYNVILNIQEMNKKQHQHH